jgi:calmodulin
MSDIKLTEEEISEFKEAFNMIDRDGGGTIGIKEIRTLLNVLGSEPPEEEVQELINEVDTDGNGEIDFAEFVTLMARKKKGSDSEEELLQAFNYIVTTTPNDAELITPEKIRKIFSNLGVELSDEDINEMLMEVDVDKDGIVEWEDFRQMYNQDRKTSDKLQDENQY